VFNQPNTPAPAGTATLTIGKLGTRLRYEILGILAHRPASVQELTRELGEEERAVMRSLAYLIQGGVVGLVGRRRHPGRGGRTNLYRAVPQVRTGKGGLLLVHGGTEDAHRFASVLGR
jgi:DNA-binding transcriptional ArsR family regulator